MNVGSRRKERKILSADVTMVVEEGSKEVEKEEEEEEEDDDGNEDDEAWDLSVSAGLPGD